jgi:hypothetical protein
MDGSASNFSSQKPVKAGARWLSDLHRGKAAFDLCFCHSSPLWFSSGFWRKPWLLEVKPKAPLFQFIHRPQPIEKKKLRKFTPGELKHGVRWFLQFPVTLFQLFFS